MSTSSLIPKDVTHVNAVVYTAGLEHEEKAFTTNLRKLMDNSWTADAKLCIEAWAFDLLQFLQDPHLRSRSSHTKVKPLLVVWNAALEVEECLMWVVKTECIGFQDSQIEKVVSVSIGWGQNPDFTKQLADEPMIEGTIHDYLSRRQKGINVMRSLFRSINEAHCTWFKHTKPLTLSFLSRFVLENVIDPMLNNMKEIGLFQLVQVKERYPLPGTDFWFCSNGAKYVWNDHVGSYYLPSFERGFWISAPLIAVIDSLVKASLVNYVAPSVSLREGRAMLNTTFAAAGTSLRTRGILRHWYHNRTWFPSVSICAVPLSVSGILGRQFLWEWVSRDRMNFDDEVDVSILFIRCFIAEPYETLNTKQRQVLKKYSPDSHPYSVTVEGYAPVLLQTDEELSYCIQHVIAELEYNARLQAIENRMFDTFDPFWIRQLLSFVYSSPSKKRKRRNKQEEKFLKYVVY